MTHVFRPVTEQQVAMTHVFRPLTEQQEEMIHVFSALPQIVPLRVTEQYDEKLRPPKLRGDGPTS
jgi:hypothetical protein